LPAVRFTMAKTESTSEMQRLLSSAIRILTMYPDYYERMGLEDDETSRYKRSFPDLAGEFEFLEKLTRALRTDDASLMELWASESEPGRKMAVADLAARQKRLGIVTANPTMWYSDDDPDNPSVAFFELTDMKNEANIERITSIIGRPGWFSSKMIYSALIRSESKEVAKKLLDEDVRKLYGFSSLMNLPSIDFALAAIDSKSDDREMHERFMEIFKKDVRAPIARALLDVMVFLPPTLHSDDMLREIGKNRRWIPDPEFVHAAALKCGSQFSRFSRATGLSSEGRSIQEIIDNSNNILESSAMSLISDLENNGDDKGMLRLLSVQVKNKDKTKPKLIDAILEACERMSLGQRARLELIRGGVEYKSGEFVSTSVPSQAYFDSMPPSQANELVRNLMGKDRSAAIGLLQNYPMGQRPGLLSVLSLDVRNCHEMPAWVRGIGESEVEARILPSGKVIAG